MVVGTTLGWILGIAVGIAVAVIVGTKVGETMGISVGTTDGATDVDSPASTKVKGATMRTLVLAGAHAATMVRGPLPLDGAINVPAALEYLLLLVQNPFSKDP